MLRLVRTREDEMMASKESLFDKAHETVGEMRSGVASAEVALGVADRALATSDHVLEDADLSIDLVERGLDTGGRVLKVVVVSAGIAIALGAGLLLARRVRSKGTQHSAGGQQSGGPSGETPDVDTPSSGQGDSDDAAQGSEAQG